MAPIDHSASVGKVNCPSQRIANSGSATRRIAFENTVNNVRSATFHLHSATVSTAALQVMVFRPVVASTDGLRVCIEEMNACARRWG